jgi:4-amino-4-deoxy-L-arabinose transferase-like glycosyltransferase
VAAAIAVAGPKHAYAALLTYHAAIGALTAVCTALLGSLFLPLWGAFLAGLLVALSPHSISMGGYLLTETTFSFLAIVAGYLTLFGLFRGKRYVSAVAGFVFGLAYLVNPVIFFVPFLLAGVALLVRRKRSPGETTDSGGRSGRCLAYFLVPFLCVVALWSGRNYLDVPRGSQSAYDRALANFIIGAHSDFFEIYRKNPRDPNNPAGIDSHNAHGSWGKFVPVLLGRIESAPWAYAKWYLLEKPYLLWSWNILVGQGDIYVYPVIKSLYSSSKSALASYSLMKALHPPMLMLALLGVPLLLWHLSRGTASAEIAVLYTILIYVTVVYVVFQAEPRYSVPFRSVLYLCTAYVMVEVSRVVARVIRESKEKGQALEPVEERPQGCGERSE